MPLIDTHAHLDLPDFARDLPAVLDRAVSAGVRRIITVGTDLASSRRAVDLAAQFPMLFATVGVHPHDAARMPAEALDELADLARRPKVVAIGEIGLDYYRDLSPRPAQRAVFAAQLDLARRLDLPVVIHCREAHAEVRAILGEQAIARRGVMHCFSGSPDDARAALDLGLHISFTGTITFPKAARTREVAKVVPLNRTMVETDCPYMAPEPRRGRRNEPAWVKYVAAALAAAHGVAPDAIAAATTAAARDLFALLAEA
jgi:TatD DNase family protein